MAQQNITISLNASDFASKVNANFSELFNEFGSGLTRQIVSKDENAGTFISKCNTNFSNLFTAASPSQQRAVLTDNMSANQVVNALNTNFDILYGTESGGGGEVVPTEKLKVLFFGNSFTSNSVAYLPFILDTFGVDYKISFYFAAGKNLAYFDERFALDAPSLYTYDSETSTAWTSAYIKPEKVLENDWDLIVLQQASADCFDEDTYDCVPSLLGKISDAYKGNTPYKVGWNVNHTRNQVAYNFPLQTLSVIQSVCNDNNIDVILPYGTAIFNALTKYDCRAYANPSNNPNRNFKLQDNQHLSPGLPMYVASLAIAQALSNEFNLGFSIEDDTTTPISGWTDPNDENYKGLTGYAITNFLAVTNEFRSIAKRAALAAITNNFSVTQLDGETLGVTYNLTGCHIDGTAPTTGIVHGQTISFRIVADEGKTMGTVYWRKLWNTNVAISLGENGEFEKVVVEDLIITATAT